MKRRPTKDTALIVEIVRTAHMLRRSVADEVSAMLAYTTKSLRDDRKWIRTEGWKRPVQLECRKKHCQRLLILRRRLRKLVKLYASFRGEHPDSRMPPERQRRVR